MQLLCSTGTFSRFPDFTDYRAILEYGPQLAVDGFELMFYPAWYAYLDRVADELGRSGLNFKAVHTEKGIGNALSSSDPAQREQAVTWLAANCWLGQQIDAEVLVLHLWGPPEFDANLDNNLEQLARCLDIAESHRIALAIETVPATLSDPLSNIQQAVRLDPRSRVALDTEFLALHDQLELVFETPWVWQEQRLRHVHIKDYDGMAFLPDGSRRYLHPGEGEIDFARFFAALKARNYTGNISLESPVISREGRVNLELLNQSLELVRRYIQA